MTASIVAASTHSAMWPHTRRSVQWWIGAQTDQVLHHPEPILDLGELLVGQREVGGGEGVIGGPDAPLRRHFTDAEIIEIAAFAMLTMGGNRMAKSWRLDASVSSDSEHRIAGRRT